MGVRPELLKRSTPLASLVLTDIAIPGSGLSPVAMGYRASKEGVVLPPGVRAFQADFALLDYGASNLTSYSYRLQDFDKDWSPWSEEKRSSAYTNLPPGSYVLLVQAQTRSGSRLPVKMSIPVQVLPAWYETYWFLVLKILAGVAVVLLVVRIRTAVLRKSEADLEREIALRISELREANEQLAILATQDALTGILNRRCFLEKAEEEIARIRRFPSRFTLLLIDVDRFKNVNDTHGHATGDAVLVAVARLLSENSRATDLVARYGGEEFVVLLVETSLEDGLIFAERLCKTAERNRVTVGGNSIRVTISLGVAETNGGEEIDQVLQRADEALYRAKSEGRNRVVAARPQYQTTSGH
jgi:diguanylate cyclase (GGDEF)-like protein